MNGLRGRRPIESWEALSEDSETPAFAFVAFPGVKGISSSDSDFIGGDSADSFFVGVDIVENESPVARVEGCIGSLQGSQG